MLDLRNFRRAAIIAGIAGGLALFLLPISGLDPLPLLNAQSFPARLRRPPEPPADMPSPASNPPPAVAPPAVASPAPQQGVAPPALPPSMLDTPAQPAKIEFTQGTLSIQAENSSLQAILYAVSSQSGMQLQGLAGDERVFGTFGPGTPRDVLASLLNGTPYNILMVGDLSDGAPRQLILSPDSGPAAVNSFAANASPSSAEDEESSGDDQAPAVAPQSPQAPAPPAATPQVVKTPQQLFQELQAMRQRQQQQQ